LNIPAAHALAAALGLDCRPALLADDADAGSQDSRPPIMPDRRWSRRIEAGGIAGKICTLKMAAGSVSFPSDLAG